MNMPDDGLRMSGRVSGHSRETKKQTPQLSENGTFFAYPKIDIKIVRSI